jgi:hypothetical protein
VRVEVKDSIEAGLMLMVPLLLVPTPATEATVHVASLGP